MMRERPFAELTSDQARTVERVEKAAPGKAAPIDLGELDAIRLHERDDDVRARVERALAKHGRQ